MKASSVVEQISALIVKHGDLEVILQADHYGYGTARGVDHTLYDGEDGTYNCPEEAPEEAKRVFVIYQ